MTGRKLKKTKNTTQKTSKLEASRDDWKAKNKERYEEIKALKMRLKETIESRNRWKEDSNSLDDKVEALKKMQEEKDAIIAELHLELERIKKKGLNHLL